MHVLSNHNWSQTFHGLIGPIMRGPLPLNAPTAIDAWSRLEKARLTAVHRWFCKFWFLRLRDKMLVFAGVVKKCLQHGHSFRLEGVWLKSENLRCACAVTRFCSSRVKKNVRNLWFSIIRIISGRHALFQCFPLLDASVPERLWQRRSHRLQYKAALWRHVQL